jgi:hypothetical protein
VRGAQDPGPRGSCLEVKPLPSILGRANLRSVHLWTEGGTSLMSNRPDPSLIPGKEADGRSPL